MRQDRLKNIMIRRRYPMKKTLAVLLAALMLIGM